jgi:hypothetical protein
MAYKLPYPPAELADWELRVCRADLEQLVKLVTPGNSHRQHLQSQLDAVIAEQDERLMVRTPAPVSRANGATA